MGWALKTSKMVTNIKGVINWASSEERVNTPGPMETFIWVNSLKGSELVRENGNPLSKEATPISEDIKMKKSMELVNIAGQMDRFSKAISKTTKSKF